MTSFRFRPRFEHVTTRSSDELEEAFRSQQGDGLCACSAQVVQGHVVIKINQEDRHYWSPQLNINLEPGDGITTIKGLYGPSPAVWGMFTLAYGAIAVLLLFIAIIGFSKKSLGMDAPILWLLPILAAAGIALYVASQLGQKFGADQTYRLHHFLEDVVGEKIVIH